MSHPSSNPLEAFQWLERESLGHPLADSDHDAGEWWRGFTFSVEGLNLVIPLVGQCEIVFVQEFVSLPMVQSWVKGVTNIKGEIYTVVDFAEFIGKSPIRISQNCHLFLLTNPDLKSALLLGHRISLKSFSPELPESNVNTFGSRLKPYLLRAISDETTNWGVLDIHALSNSNEFCQIGR